MVNEKRLIDANTAADGIVAQLENEWGYDGIREDVQRVLDSTPTVDAVEVVRCKDCKSFDDETQECYRMTGFRANDFCSYGERKNND